LSVGARAGDADLPLEERFVLAVNFDLMDPAVKGLDQVATTFVRSSRSLNFGGN
jgi:hypothetical protein